MTLVPVAVAEFGNVQVTFVFLYAVAVPADVNVAAPAKDEAENTSVGVEKLPNEAHVYGCDESAPVPAHVLQLPVEPVPPRVNVQVGEPLYIAVQFAATVPAVPPDTD